MDGGVGGGATAWKSLGKVEVPADGVAAVSLHELPHTFGRSALRHVVHRTISSFSLILNGIWEGNKVHGHSQGNIGLAGKFLIP